MIIYCVHTVDIDKRGSDTRRKKKSATNYIQNESIRWINEVADGYHYA